MSLLSLRKSRPWNTAAWRIVNSIKCSATPGCCYEDSGRMYSYIHRISMKHSWNLRCDRIRAAAASLTTPSFTSDVYLPVGQNGYAIFFVAQLLVPITASTSWLVFQINEAECRRRRRRRRNGVQAK